MARSEQLPVDCYRDCLSLLLIRLYRGPEWAMRLRLLRWLEVALGEKRIIARVRPGIKMALDHADLIQRNLLLESVYEPELVELLSAKLRPGDVVYDIGANCGYFSCVAAHLGVAAVVAFEPDPVSAEVAEQNLRLNRASGSGFRMHRIALADYEGKVAFHRTHVSNTGLSGLYARNPVRTFDVPVTTVDAIIAARHLPAPTVVKIDVEGAEVAVLRGARDTLTRCRPRLVIFESECDNTLSPKSETLSVLRAAGYSVKHLRRSNGQVEAYENFVAQL